MSAIFESQKMSNLERKFAHSGVKKDAIVWYRKTRRRELEPSIFQVKTPAIKGKPSWKGLTEIGKWSSFLKSRLPSKRWMFSRLQKLDWECFSKLYELEKDNTFTLQEHVSMKGRSRPQLHLWSLNSFVGMVFTREELK